MGQLSFIGMEPKKRIRSARFLDEMNRVVPWKRLCRVIEPHYHLSPIGRTKTPLLLLLKIYCLQQWYNLSDPGVEDAVYDRLSFQRFLGLGEPGDSVPDETTILNFRHLLERHKLTGRLFDEINLHLQKHGVLMSKGTIVDATLIAAPSSTKNEQGQRDPEMSSTKKGNNYHFGMKCHIGVSMSAPGLIHSVKTTTAKVHDSQVMDELLHGRETAVLGDKAYDSSERAAQARNQGTAWCVQKKAPRGGTLSRLDETCNAIYSRLRARVEHPFQVVKHLWGHRKVRYKGLYKNACQFEILFGLCNLYKARRLLLREA